MCRDVVEMVIKYISQAAKAGAHDEITAHREPSVRFSISRHKKMTKGLREDSNKHASVSQQCARGLVASLGLCQIAGSGQTGHLQTLS